MIRFEIFQWFPQTFLTKWTGSNIYHLLLAFFYSRVEVEIRHNKRKNFIFMFLYKGQVFARDGAITPNARPHLRHCLEL